MALSKNQQLWSNNVVVVSDKLPDCGLLFIGERDLRKKKKKVESESLKCSYWSTDNKRNCLRVTHDINPSRGKENFTSFLIFEYILPMYMNPFNLSRLPG